MKFPKVKVGIKKQVVTERPADPAPIPEAPKLSGIFEGQVLSQAKNPQWVYAKINGIDGKHPVIIPRRMTGKLTGKTVKIEAITDATGTSYRYVTPTY